MMRNVMKQLPVKIKMSRMHFIMAYHFRFRSAFGITLCQFRGALPCLVLQHLKI
ncbi:hypothetical protein Hdeb2414_s0036g00731811 [Helianthus debilis subsp. tardiflorus]